MLTIIVRKNNRCAFSAVAKAFQLYLSVMSARLCVNIFNPLFSVV